MLECMVLLPLYGNHVCMFYFKEFQFFMCVCSWGQLSRQMMVWQRPLHWSEGRGHYRSTPNISPLPVAIGKVAQWKMHGKNGQPLPKPFRSEPFRSSTFGEYGWPEIGSFSLKKLALQKKQQGMDQISYLISPKQRTAPIQESLPQNSWMKTPLGPSLMALLKTRNVGEEPPFS